MSKNDSICRSGFVEPSVFQYQGVEDQNPTTESLLSMYDILRNAFDVCSDGDAFHTEEVETWEDKVANPLRTMNHFGGVSGKCSEGDDFRAFVMP